MVDCHDMKEGQIYACPKCGLEIQIVKECQTHCAEGACEDEACDDCVFACCGENMQLK